MFNCPLHFVPIFFFFPARQGKNEHLTPVECTFKNNKLNFKIVMMAFIHQELKSILEVSF